MFCHEFPIFNFIFNRKQKKKRKNERFFFLNTTTCNTFKNRRLELFWFVAKLKVKLSKLKRKHLKRRKKMKKSCKNYILNKKFHFTTWGPSLNNLSLRMFFKIKISNSKSNRKKHKLQIFRQQLDQKPKKNRFMSHTTERLHSEQF